MVGKGGREEKEEEEKAARGRERWVPPAADDDEEEGGGGAALPTDLLLHKIINKGLSDTIHWPFNLFSLSTIYSCHSHQISSHEETCLSASSSHSSTVSALSSEA